MNLMEIKVRNGFVCIGTGKDFLNRIPLTQQQRSIIDKMGPHETE